MKTDIAGPTTPTKESLDGLVREKAQELIQQILQEEITELLGRQAAEPKATGDPDPAREATASPMQALAQKAAAQELGNA